MVTNPVLRLPLRVRMGGLALLTFGAVLVQLNAWRDLFHIGWVDAEQSQVLLAPFVALLIIGMRLEQLKRAPIHSDLLGLVPIVVGWLISWVGFHNAIQSFWHGGAVLCLIGVAWTVLGRGVMLRLLPAVVVLGFLVPVPGMIRETIAIPMQNAAARATQFAFDLFAVDVTRTGNVLWYRGEPVGIAEACNGMRMIFALVLVSYAAIFITPLRTWVRVVILLISPLIALVCNVIRLVPTVWFYGSYPDAEWVSTFHDTAGWVMIFIGFGIVLGVIELFKWLCLPVTDHRSWMNHGTNGGASDAAGGSSDGPGGGSGAGLWRFASPPQGSMHQLAPLLGLLLVVGIGVESRFRPQPADAEPYHARVRRAALDVPRNVGVWRGRDVEVPESAVALLRPNALVARRYVHERTGERVTFLLVQCKAARSMQGHYPPNCYPRSGWTMLEARPTHWQVDGWVVPGMEYDFALEGPGETRRVTVANLLLMPDGSFERQISSVYEAAADYTRSFYGAAQMQLVMPADLSPQRRKAVVEQFLAPNAELMEVILKSGAGSGEWPAEFDAP